MLKESRLRAGFRSQAALARELHLSRPVLSRAENPAHPVPSDDVLTEWARVTDADLDEMRELAARATGSAPEWFVNYLTAEQTATLLRLWAMVIVPGLFQTEDYARAVLALHPHTPERLAGLLDARMKRQVVLDSTRTIAVMDASVLSRCLGSPAVMAEQCRRLAELAERPNISLHILPEGVSVGIWAGINIASRGSVATVSLSTGLDDITTTAADQVDAATDALERAMCAAMPCPDSLDFVRTWEATWKERM